MADLNLKVSFFSNDAPYDNSSNLVGWVIIHRAVGKFDTGSVTVPSVNKETASQLEASDSPAWSSLTLVRLIIHESVGLNRDLSIRANKNLDSKARCGAITQTNVTVKGRALHQRLLTSHTLLYAQFIVPVPPTANTCLSLLSTAAIDALSGPAEFRKTVKTFLQEAFERHIGETQERRGRSSVTTHPNESVKNDARLETVKNFKCWSALQTFPIKSQTFAPSFPPNTPEAPEVEDKERYYRLYHPAMKLVAASEAMLSSSRIAALYSFLATSTFEEGPIFAVNLGDDADTVGAARRCTVRSPAVCGMSDLQHKVLQHEDK
ncbi:hypothetical protein L218DRAFT_988029 [Marasmius fiardii PR-910]|nr:hypothetical protein L218DRAFT_988029 [Marasmius fiardii PR-910]